MSDLPVEKFDLEALATSIQSVHTELSRQASKAVNVSLTLRNWLIGCYIAEYELRGSDRAEYGEKVLVRLAERVEELNVSTCDRRRLYEYTQFYKAYPQIVRTLSAQLQVLLPKEFASPEPRLNENANGYFLFSFLISRPSVSRTADPQTLAHQTFATNRLVFNSDSMAAVRHRQCDCVPKSDTAREGYDLSINRYKEVVHEEVVHRPPQAILDELESIEKEITQGMKQLRGMLK